MINVEAKFKTFEPHQEVKQPSKVKNKVLIQIVDSLLDPAGLQHQEAILDCEEKKDEKIANKINVLRTPDLFPHL